MESTLPVNGSQLTVRRAEPRDAEAIVGLSLAVQALHVAARPDIFKPGGSETPPEVAARLGREDQLYWVATLDAAVVGYAYARLDEEPETRWKFGARLLTLDQMGVSAGHRRHGVGRHLWEAVRQEAVARGVDRVLLNVWAFNAPAQRFYERLGFARFNQRMALELRAPPAPRDARRARGRADPTADRTA